MIDYSESTGPSRREVEEWWSRLVEGGLSREDAHALAAPWVEEHDSAINDPMAKSGLQQLHGCNLKHDLDRPNVMSHRRGEAYVHSDREIAERLVTWRENCLLHDADPEGYARSARYRALDALWREEGGMQRPNQARCDGQQRNAQP